MKDRDTDKVELHKLPIRPMQIKGEIKMVPVAELKSGKMDTSIEISDAVVAFLDILGFSERKDDTDIENCLLDFSGPLILASRKYSDVRFNIFSDCAFVSSSQDNADDLLSSIRFAFAEWVSDGILVRGGIAKGTYREINSAAQKMASNNTVCSIFSGSAVVNAVKLEGNSPGALLFTNDKCAEFYNKNYGEPIFSLSELKIIGWSDEIGPLFCFAGLSILRLLKLLSLSLDNESVRLLSLKFINNIQFSHAITSDKFFPWSIISIILSSPVISPSIRKKFLNALKANEDDIYKLNKEDTDHWFNRQDVQFLIASADMDSSIPTSPILSDMINVNKNKLT